MVSMPPRCSFNVAAYLCFFNYFISVLLTLKLCRLCPLVLNFGDSARYDAVDAALGRLQSDARSDSDAHSDAPSVVGSDGARSDAASGSYTSGDGSGPDGSKSSSTLAVTKFASMRGASVYFCRDEECYRCSAALDQKRKATKVVCCPPATLVSWFALCAGFAVFLLNCGTE